jgi:phosphatidylserine decarboxylase
LAAGEIGAVIALTLSLLSLVGLVAVGAGLWPRLQRHLIVSERAPIALREFAAASLSQQGVLKLLLYHCLLPWVDVRLPRRLTTWLCRQVGRQQAVDFSELDRPVEQFPTLNTFFTRPLRDECRPICPDPGVIVAPADADVTETGAAAAGRIIRAQGASYALGDLLPAAEASAFAGGRYVVLYLRPGDCHRVFCPDAAQVAAAICIPGNELPIAPAITALVPQVFVQNRRMAHLLVSARGPMALVMVGAYKVGRMVPQYDPAFGAGRAAAVARRDYAPAPALGRGQWLATFHLGSAIVLLFPPGAIGEFRVEPGDRIKYGQPLAAWASSRP